MEELERREVLANYIATTYENLIYLIRTDYLEIKTYPLGTQIELTNQNDTIKLYGEGIAVNGLGGNDTMTGNTPDSLYGADGDDVIVGGTAGLADGGTGLNVVNGAYTYDETYNNPTHVYNNVELQAAVNSTYDRIYVHPGSYTSNLIINRELDLVGVDNPTLNCKMDVRAKFYMANLKVDITGQTKFANGYVNGFCGQTVLNNVEVFGLGANTSALYFYQRNVTVNSIVLNGYVHDVADDCYSTGVYGSQVVNSTLTIYNSRGERSGPNSNNQVLTAHGGFTLNVMGGFYRDAHTNVVAPDSVTQINLYDVTISAGNRKAGIYRPNVLYGCTLLNQTKLTLYGPTSYCYIEGGNSNYFIDNYGSFRYNTVRKTTGVYPIRAYGEVVDNIFENWTYPPIDMGGLGENTFI